MGLHLTSYIPTTALAAIALQNDGSNQKIIDNALAYLEREIGTNVSTLNLALTILCFNVYGRNTEELKPRLLARQESDGSWRGNAHLTSLSALALETFGKGAANAFKI